MHNQDGNNRKDNIECEIAELFAEYSVDDFDGGTLSMRTCMTFDEMSAFNSKSINYENESLSDVFINWFESFSEKNPYHDELEDFLRCEAIQNFITPDAFRDVVSGSAFVPAEFLYIIKQKLPFKLSARKLERLNYKAKVKNDSYCIAMPVDEVMQLRSELQKKERERRYQHNLMKQAEYRKRNRETINHKRRQRWHENFEERLKNRIRLLKKYYQNQMTPELNKKLHYLEHEALRKHNYYLANKEAFRERCLKWRDENPERLKQILKEYRRRHAARIAATKHRYYEKHKAELSEKNKTWRENNPEKVQETSRRNYAENREKRLAQNKEWIRNNPEARQRQKARYRAAHAAEIAAKEARRRNKKRFQTKTGAEILALLQGIIQTRS